MTAKQLLQNLKKIDKDITLQIVIEGLTYRLLIKKMKSKWALSNYIDKSKEFVLKKVVDIEIKMDDTVAVLYIERLRNRTKYLKETKVSNKT